MMNERLIGRNSHTLELRELGGQKVSVPKAPNPGPTRRLQASDPAVLAGLQLAAGGWPGGYRLIAGLI